VVLAARIAGDRRRPWMLRASALVACAPLGLGLYLSFSRGALFACAAGLLTLVVAAPERGQIRAALLALVAVVLAAAASAAFSGVTALSGSLSTRETEGAAVLIALVVIGGAAAIAGRRLLVPDPPGRMRLPRHSALLALVLVCTGLAVAIIAGAHETSGRPLAGGATRLTTFESNRYDYWRVALHAFGQEPLRGVGAGGWAVQWLRRRPYAFAAQDAHSLPLQTAAELGIVGLVLLAGFLGGLTVAARRAHRLAPAAAAGPLAGCVVYIAHSPLDWDWQMPALTIVALVLAGALLALADDAPARPAGRPLEGGHHTPTSATVSASHASSRTSGAEGAGAGSHRY
jgi:O-Antigen ligase